MPTNLTVECITAMEAYDRATTLKEKILAIQEVLATIPKHKGTEKLRMVWKRKLARVRETEEKAVGAGKRFSYSVKKEGAAQVAMVGAPNAGKSSILASLTNADVAVADYPFTTTAPEVGMMDVGRAKVQLIEVPAVVEDWRDTDNGPAFLGLVRNADVALAVVDASEAPVEALDRIVDELASGGIVTDRPAPPVKVEATVTGGIEVLGEKYLEGDVAEVREGLQARQIHNAVVRIMGPCTVADVERVMDRRLRYMKLVVAATKCDRPGSAEGFEAMRRAYPFLTVVPVSTELGKGLDQLKGSVWEALGLVRVFTKPPGKPRVEVPIALPVGATVKDVATGVHKDLLERFTFARVWGSARFPGQRVGLEYALADGDTVEIHISK